MCSLDNENHLIIGVAGCVAKTVVAPLDRIKILLQAHNQHYKHLGIGRTFIEIYRKEGFLGFYKGNGVQMIRIFPYSGIQFFINERCKIIFNRHTRSHPHINRIAAGSVAGLTAVLFTYPLDIARSRLAFQVTGEHRYLGLRHLLKCMIYSEGGMKALYRGIVPTMIGMVPYSGLSFFCFGTLKEICLKYFPDQCGTPCDKNKGQINLNIPTKLVCGGISGAVSQTITYPLDIVRRRLQVSVLLPDSHKYEQQGWVETLRLIKQENGIVNGLYRGLSINYIRVIPMAAVSFSTFETLSEILINYTEKKHQIR
ncbi:hypothetical protein LOTGIDRAFT_135819 [Lottia gigantea]|uniref:Uncharacterized protein n=1 Tax=Lottia gigantea TaxID=225164 RepID=V4AKB0_LOTGI|nr:hypothetical protein LOTGIDRAFT_135819 [Lottia gigantea]ESP04634.1 hypothetical protein LOTGIDRAFT_135819 [Lottia gigantea]